MTDVTMINRKAAIEMAMIASPGNREDQKEICELCEFKAACGARS